MRIRKPVTIVACVALALGPTPTPAQASYRRAELESTGQLRIVVSTNKVLRPPKDSDQAAFGQVALSRDRRMVGWVALYPNCCTSYPIPLKLVLLGAGARRIVISNGSPVWQWAFSA